VKKSLGASCRNDRNEIDDAADYEVSSSQFVVGFLKGLSFISRMRTERSKRRFVESINSAFMAFTHADDCVKTLKWKPGTLEFMQVI
jgi:hypothetical protein